jgi:Cupin-like domain
MMFRLRRAYSHHRRQNEHDSDNEEEEQQQQKQKPLTDSTGNNNNNNTQLTNMTKSRKKNRQYSTVFAPIQRYAGAARYERSSFVILILAMMGCILTGCTIMATLQLYTGWFQSNTNSSSSSSKYSSTKQRRIHGNLRDDSKGQEMHAGYGNRDGFDEQQDQRLVDRNNGERNNNRRYRRHGQFDDDEDDAELLPWNPIYRIPEASATVGDRSDAYARLRQEIDAILPINPQRSLQRVQELQKLVGSQTNTKGISYDIYNCPDEPPPGYPYQWKLVDEILHDWPAASVRPHEIPSKIYNGLCIFDFVHDFDKALRYRNAELPFVVVHDPDVARTVERWAIPGYMQELLGENVQHRAQYNTNGHFMYHVAPPPPRRGGGRRDNMGYRQRRHRRRHGAAAAGNSRDEPKDLYDLYGRPAKLQRADVMPDELRMTYKEWLAKANATTTTNNNNNKDDDEHWYFRLIGCGYMGADGSCDAGSSEYLFDELPFFQPVDNLYLAQPDSQKGIHCRFGMPGVIAENHFDGSRNSIAVLHGSRRYVLSRPNQCDKLTILPLGHPSARHSAVDYTNPDLETFPEFAEAMANEVILQAGQVLYLPTNWFHFIVSLELNMQCNTRSGISDHYPLDSCGF